MAVCVIGIVRRLLLRSIKASHRNKMCSWTRHICQADEQSWELVLIVDIEHISYDLKSNADSQLTVKGCREQSTPYLQLHNCVKGKDWTDVASCRFDCKHQNFSGNRFLLFVCMFSDITIEYKRIGSAINCYATEINLRKRSRFYKICQKLLLLDGSTCCLLLFWKV
jgi:hypothetical protein